MAPRMTPMAWRSFIILALTKPTTMTEVAQEDWITAVTPVPSSTPFSVVLERRKRIGSSLLPETRLSPSPMRDMPNRNRATPHSREMTSVTPKENTLLLRRRGGTLRPAGIRRIRRKSIRKTLNLPSAAR